MPYLWRGVITVVIDKCGSIVGEAFKANDVTSIVDDP